MKLLITGATGSIGKHLVKALVAQGHSCRCLVRETSKVDFLREQGVELFYGDLLFPKTLKGIVSGMDAVFHLAAEGHVSSKSTESFKKFLKINVEGTRNLLKECINSQIVKFVHFSSTAAMGLIEDILVDEQTPCVPTTAYQKAKLKSEQVVMDYFKKEGIPAVILRPCMVYGEECKGEYLRIFTLIKKGIFPKMGCGLKLTPLIYIHNLITAVVNTLTLAKPGNVYLLVDSSVGMDMLRNKVCKYLNVNSLYLWMPAVVVIFIAKIYEIFCGFKGKDPKFTVKNVKSTIANRIFNTTKAEKELDFKRIVGLDESLKRTIDWARENKYL